MVNLAFLAYRTVVDRTVAEVKERHPLISYHHLEVKLEGHCVALGIARWFEVCQ